MEHTMVPPARTEVGLARARIPGLTTLAQKTDRQDTTIVWANRELECIPSHLSMSQAWKQVQFINLNSNLLREIPVELGVCQQLRHLDLSDNLIGELGSKVGPLPNLIRLNMSRNRIRRVREEDVRLLGRLKTLILSENLIAEVTWEIRKLSGLRVLYLDRNPLETIPGSVRELAELKELKLDWPAYLLPPRSASLMCPDALARLHSVQSHSATTALPVSDSLSLQEFSTVLAQYSSDSQVHFAQVWTALQSPLVYTESVESFPTRFVDAHQRQHESGCQTLSRLLDQAICSHHSGVANIVARMLVGLEEHELPCYRRYEPIEVSLNLGLSELALSLLQAGIKPVQMPGPDSTILHQAASQLAIEVINHLVSLGFPVNTVDNHRNTLMHRVLQLKHEKGGYKLAEMIPDWEVQQSSGIVGNSTELNGTNFLHKLSRGDSMAAAAVGVRAGDCVGSKDSTSSSSARASFDRAVTYACEKLVELGVDPNSYNTHGICAWHIPIMTEDLELFSQLRASPGLDKIDWNLSALGGEQPILHLASKQKEWRIFLELLEGKLRSISIQFDNELLLPDSSLRPAGSTTITSKIYLRYLKHDYRVFLRTIASWVQKEDLPSGRKILLPQRSRISITSRSASRDNTRTEDGRDESQDSVLIGSKRYVPKSATKITAPKSFGIGSFHSIESIEEPSQARKVYVSTPKQSLTINKSNFSPSFLHDLKENNHRSGLLQLNSNHTRTLASSHQINWLQMKLSNMAVQGSVGKAHLLRQPLRKEAQSNSGKQDPPKTLHRMQLLSPTPFKRQTSVLETSNNTGFRVPQLELMVNKPLILASSDRKPSRVHNHVKSNSQVPMLKLKPDSQTIVLDDLFKMYVKLLLKDTINFRYSCKWLAKQANSSSSAQKSEVNYHLSTALAYLSKATIVLNLLFKISKSDLSKELLLRVKQELNHDNCLKGLSGYLQSSLLTPNKDNGSLGYLESLQRKILGILQAMFGEIKDSFSQTPLDATTGTAMDSDRKYHKAKVALVRPQSYQKKDVEDSDSLDPDDGQRNYPPVLPKTARGSQIAEEEPSIDSERQLNRNFLRSNRFMQGVSSANREVHMYRPHAKLSADFCKKLFPGTVQQIALPGGTGTSILRRLAKPSLWPAAHQSLSNNTATS